MRGDFDYFHTLRVRYAEVDGQSVVFNANYLTYADVAFTEYFRHIDLDYLEMLEKHNRDVVLVNSNLNYRAPARFDDLLEIGVKVSKIGNTSYTLYLEIFRQDEDEVLVDISSTYVNIDTRTGKPAPVSDYFREKIPNN
jgi:acyl-CoA thioester hydrolase